MQRRMPPPKGIHENVSGALSRKRSGGTPPARRTRADCGWSGRSRASTRVPAGSSCPPTCSSSVKSARDDRHDRAHAQRLVDDRRQVLVALARVDLGRPGARACSGWRTSRSTAHATDVAVVSCPASSSVTSSSRSSSSVIASPSSSRACSSSERMSVRSARSLLRAPARELVVDHLVEPSSAAPDRARSGARGSGGAARASTIRSVLHRREQLADRLAQRAHPLGLDAEHRAQDHLQRDRARALLQAHRLAERPARHVARASPPRSRLLVLAHPLAVERRQQQLALAHVLGPGQHDHRARPHHAARSASCRPPTARPRAAP